MIKARLLLTYYVFFGVCAFGIANADSHKLNPAYGKYSAALGYQAMFDALKPGGILGVVDHRWPDPKNEDPDANDGYLSEDRIIAQAEAAGFKFVARSDINRNDKDNHKHPQGVWTLPPSYALGDVDKEKYSAIGESDRLTLRFVKPVEPAN